MKPMTLLPLHVIGALAVIEAFARKPGFAHERALPLNDNPTPPKVVVCNCPFTSAERSVFVAIAKTVDELKVAVELKVAPPVKAWRFVHAPDEAKVTKPGFVKLIVTEPVALEFAVRGPAEVSAVTPVFWTEKMFEEVEIEMPVEAFRAMVPVRLPKEPTPATVPVALLKEPAGRRRAVP